MHLAAIVGDPACALDPAAPTRSTCRPPTRARGRRQRGRRRAPGVRLDLLELRPHGRPDRADHRGGRAAPGVAVRRAEGRHGEADPRRRHGRRQAHLPALCDRLRRRAADALRSDRQRVHPRPVGRPRAGSVRRAVLASLHPRARRGARGAHGARGARGEGRRQRLQRRALGRELPQARPRRGDRQADRPRQASPMCAATRTRATTR